MTITAGDAVRGTAATMRIDGLTALRGKDAEVRIVTPAPVFVGGRDIVGYRSVGSAAVDRQGSAVVDFVVPNALSGEDDVISLLPGGSYVLEVAPKGQPTGATVRIPFAVAPARSNVPYHVNARRGPEECGAPPLEVDFDGAMWTTTDPGRLPVEQTSFDGVLTLETAGSGRFVATDGTAITVTRAASGYSC
jgi:hypothetical protein